MDHILIPGGKIELSEISENSNRVNFYLSQIYDIEENDKKLSIAMPIKEGKLISLAVGMKLNCFFFTKAGIFHSVVVITNRYRNENLYYMDIELKTPLKKQQRRQYFRFETSMDVRYAVMDEEAIDVIETLKCIPDNLFDGKLLLGSTINISGGGLRFIGNELEKGSKVYIEMDYTLANKQKCFKAICNVISSEPNPNRHNISTNCLNYEIIREDERESLIKFIFEEDRKARRNERR